MIPPCGLVPAGTSCAQRANALALRSVGVESEAEWRPAPAWSLWVSYTFNPTRVSAPEQPNDGKWARGAARHYASAALAWDEPRIATIALEERYVGSRYDDDVNAIELPASS